MGRYPDRKSASIPALWAVQRRYGWCTPEGIRQAAAVMRVTPAYLESVASFYDLLHTEPVGHPQSRRLHQHQLLDARRRRAARRLPRRRRGRRGRLRHRLRVPRAPATSRRWPRSTSATSGRSRRPRRGRRSSSCWRAARCCRRRRSRSGRWRATARTAEGSLMAHELETRVLLEHAEDPELAHDRRLQGPRRLRDPGEGLQGDGGRRDPQGARRVRPARPRRRRLLDGQKGLLPAARRHGRSTSAATPTSPSRAPSRTAS